jgi:orotidine-5'-phosphate decarboxylase
VRAGWRAATPGGAVAPIIVSSSRAVLYASSGADFGSAARAVADVTRRQLNAARSEN